LIWAVQTFFFGPSVKSLQVTTQFSNRVISVRCGVGGGGAAGWPCCAGAAGACADCAGGDGRGRDEGAGPFAPGVTCAMLTESTGTATASVFVPNRIATQSALTVKSPSQRRQPANTDCNTRRLIPAPAGDAQR